MKLRIFQYGSPILRAKGERVNEIDEKIRQLTVKNADAQSIKVQGTKAGMRTLREDGAQKVMAGMTTTAEVLMITTQDVD